MCEPRRVMRQYIKLLEYSMRSMLWLASYIVYCVAAPRCRSGCSDSSLRVAHGVLLALAIIVYGHPRRLFVRNEPRRSARVSRPPGALRENSVSTDAAPATTPGRCSPTSDCVTGLRSA